MSIEKLRKICEAQTPVEFHRANWDFLFPEGTLEWSARLVNKEMNLSGFTFLARWDTVHDIHTGEVLPFRLVLSGPGSTGLGPVERKKYVHCVGGVTRPVTLMPIGSLASCGGEVPSSIVRDHLGIILGLPRFDFFQGTAYQRMEKTHIPFFREVESTKVSELGDPKVECNRSNTP